MAPNLCQLVGVITCSRLISTAGGLRELAAMPACNIEAMSRQNTIFEEMDIVTDVPERYRRQLLRMLASNTAKCVRADMLKSSKGLGEKMKEDMYERFEKIQEEGGLHRMDKPLPVPGEAPKKKRGGKRYRKQKELLAMTELRKQQNRVKFGEAVEEIGEGVDMGMLTQGTGRLRVSVKSRKLNVSKKTQARMNKQSGMESSVNINSTQGIQLVNPLQSQEAGKQSGQESIFSKSAGFHTVLNNKVGPYK